MHSVLAVLCVQAAKCQDEFINGLAPWHLIAYEEHTRHRLLCLNSLKGKTRNSLAVVSEQDPMPSGSPSQDDRIGRTAKAGIANSNKVQVWNSTQKSAQDIALEVLVAHQLNHTSPLLSRGP